jgi:hypothetical protein
MEAPRIVEEHKPAGLEHHLALQRKWTPEAIRPVVKNEIEQRRHIHRPEHPPIVWKEVTPILDTEVAKALPRDLNPGGVNARELRPLRYRLSDDLRAAPHANSSTAFARDT